MAAALPFLQKPQVRRMSGYEYKSGAGAMTAAAAQQQLAEQASEAPAGGYYLMKAGGAGAMARQKYNYSAASGEAPATSSITQQ